MIKLIYCLRRVPGLSLREFQEHWLEQHARFGRDNRITRRYVQYHRLEDDPIVAAMAQAGASQVEPFDGVAISWWDDLDSVRTAMDSPEVAAALEDERHFIDHRRSTACLTTERVIIEPCADVPIVLFECLRRRSDIDRAEFSRRWEEHGKIGRRAHAAKLLMGYVQNVTLTSGAQDGLEAIAGPDSWDGVTTGYFESIAKMKTLMASPLVTQDAYKEERAFMDHSRSGFFVTRRHLIRDIIR